MKVLVPAATSNCSNMLPASIFKILHIFDVFGFNSGLTKFSLNPHLAQFIYIVHISMALLATLFIYSIIEFLSSKDFIEAISELLQYLSVLITYWLIIYDAYVMRQVNKKFWNKLKWIDGHIYCQSNLCFRNFIIKFVEFFPIKICTVIITIAYNIDNFKIDFMYNFLFKIFEIRLFYYLFCLEIIIFQLEQIEIEIKNVSSVINVPKLHSLKIRKSIYTFELNRLKWVRNYVFNIHEMIVDLNRIFGWSHVATILSSFYLLLSQLNWSYVHFHEFSFVCGMGKLSCQWSFKLGLMCSANSIGLMQFNLKKYIFYFSFQAVILVIVHVQLIIIYLFYSSARCSKKV